jgi:hypothetical protein
MACRDRIVVPTTSLVRKESTMNVAVPSLQNFHTNDLLGYRFEFAPPATPSRFPGRTDQHSIKTFGAEVASFDPGELAAATAFAQASSQGAAGVKALVLVHQPAFEGGDHLGVFDTIDVVTRKYWGTAQFDDFGSTSLEAVDLSSIPDSAGDGSFDDRKFVALVDDDVVLDAKHLG